MIRIISAKSPLDYHEGLRLFEEYLASLDFDLSFQNVDKERNALSEMYGEPTGALLLVKSDESFVGVAGIRRIEDEHTCEIKRMYIKPSFRGKGFGKLLMKEAIATARELGYNLVKLDTHAVKMPGAVQLYKSFGFEEIEPYNYNPYEGIVYFQKSLKSPS